MIILLNGPLGIGKSTLAEALSESIAWSVMLDGDHIVAVNPAPSDEVEHLHSTITLFIEHHRSFGYRHFVINHLWISTAELDDLRKRVVEEDPDIRCFLLTLPAEENLRRIQIRATARVGDEQSCFEEQTSAKERKLLMKASETELGEPFDVSAPPSELVERILGRIGMARK